MDDFGIFGFVYQFPARIDEWHDGDTVYVHQGIQPGKVLHGQHVRVEGINAPELHEKDGLASRDYAASLAPPGTPVQLVSSKEDKYGRLLARIVLPDGRDFSSLMIAAGHAVPMASRTKEEE